MKKKPPYNQNAAIRGALRRAFARSPVVQEVMAESRREVPKYKKDGTRAKKNAVQRQCQTCGQWVGSTKLNVDHVNPVISVDDGFVDWNAFIDRLWCAKSNLHRICLVCHNIKTAAERIMRLRIKYNKELDIIKQSITVEIQSGINPLKSKQIKKELAKYIAKKKIIGLEEIVQRAQLLRDRIKL